MFRPSVPDHLLALTTFQSRCVKTVSCLPPQGGHNILYILPIYCQYNANIQKMISSSCRMSWAFWLEGVCIPIISTFGLLGKVFLQLFFSLKLSFNFQATSAPSGFWAAGGPTWTSAQPSPPFLFVWWAIMLACLSHSVACLVLCPFYWWSIHQIKICLVHCFIYYSWKVCRWMPSSEVILSCIFLRIVRLDAFITVSCYLSYYLPGDQFFNQFDDNDKSLMWSCFFVLSRD